jgi:Flp pilus assembly protein TadG
VRGDRWSRGDSTVEFAILALPILLLTFAFIQAAFVWYAHTVALAAATQGANTARLYGSSSAAGRTKAEEFLNNVGPALHDATVSATVSNNRVTVVVRGQAPTILPGMSFSVTQSASGPVERFVP